MEFESLIFDIDGTLWDPREPIAAGYNLQLREEGLDRFSTTPQALTSLFGKVAEEIGDILMPELPVDFRHELVRRCINRGQRYMEENDLDIGYPNVMDTLEKLSQSHRLFIVSNSLRGYPQLCMGKMGIGHLIQGSLCYGDTGKTKAETIRMLMDTHGIQSACYIGDTLADQVAADGAGIPFIHCRYGFGTPEHCWKAIDRFADLLTL